MRVIPVEAIGPAKSDRATGITANDSVMQISRDLSVHSGKCAQLLFSAKQRRYYCVALGKLFLKTERDGPEVRPDRERQEAAGPRRPY
jgi:hypothetical protein